MRNSRTVRLVVVFIRHWFYVMVLYCCSIVCHQIHFLFSFIFFVIVLRYRYHTLLYLLIIIVIVLYRIETLTVTNHMLLVILESARWYPPLYSCQDVALLLFSGTPPLHRRCWLRFVLQQHDDISNPCRHTGHLYKGPVFRALPLNDVYSQAYYFVSCRHAFGVYSHQMALCSYRQWQLGDTWLSDVPVAQDGRNSSNYCIQLCLCTAFLLYRNIDSSWPLCTCSTRDIAVY